MLNSCQAGQISPLYPSCVNMISLGQGATVVTGPQGPAGATGATGAQGVQGLQGLMGAQGQAGINGTSLLWNPFVNYTNTGAGAGDVNTNTIPATAFVTPSNGVLGGDQVQISIEGYTNVGGGTFPANSIILKAGSTIIAYLYDTNPILFKATIYLTYTTATNIRVDGVIQYYDKSTNLWLSEFIINTVNISYAAGNTLGFTVSFAEYGTASDAVLIFNQALNYKINSGTPIGFTPIYTVGNNTSTYQNNALIGQSSSNFSVFVDGLLCIPTTRWTFVSSTGTITFVGGSVTSSQSLAIIPN